MRVASYIKSLILGVLAASVCACNEVDPENNSAGITLDVLATPATKADKVGEDLYNENQINSIHYFFYSKGDHSQAILYGNQTGLNVKGQASVRVNMDEGTVNNILFPRPENKCDVFIIVNLPSGTEIPTDTSLENLKAIALSADFTSTNKQSSFVMQGLGEAVIIDRKQTLAASGTIPVARVASKLTVGVIVPPKYELKDNNDVVQETWIPQPEGLKVVLHKGKNTATIGAEPQPVGSNHFISSEQMFSDGTLPGVALSTGDRAFACKSPFYTYPEIWDLGDDDAPYLAITLPWSLDDGSGSYSFQDCYYKVLLNGTSLEANNWYNVNVRLGVLGSFTEKDPQIEIQDNYVTYYVEDWTEALTDNENIMMNIVQAEIKGAQYLVVPTTSYTLYNQNSVAIPFSSSHECEIVDVTATKTDFSKSTPETVSVNGAGAWLGIDGNHINFTHTLNNDLSSKKYDVSPIIVTFTIRHTTANDAKHEYTERITITQYPALTISFKESETKNYNNGTYTGYVFVNNGENLTNLGDNSGTTVDRTSNNANRNLYVISTSVLPNGSNYILGDPRLKTIDNLDWTVNKGTNNRPNYQNGWASAPSVYGTSPRPLTYYYRTGNTEDYEMIIAPKFRIASSYGATQPENYENSNRRCASYQEDGFPAGRWRLPTRAEIEYIAQLNVDGYIPRLLGQASGSTDYWCGTGYVSVNPSAGTMVFTSGTTDNSHYIRCVYDEWYWENSSKATVAKNTFTWGDMPREQFN